MNTLPNVSSEGGPLILSDAGTLRGWHGGFGSGGDYAEACAATTDGLVGSIREHILVWELEGAGTAYLASRTSDSFTLIRIWAANGEPSDDEIRDMLQLAIPTPYKAHFRLRASPAVLIWAAEEATQISIPPALEGVPLGDWSMGGTAYYFPVYPGNYEAAVHEYQSENLSFFVLVCHRQAD
ncbi:hypothetical protein [Roseimicrobium sp. ORNL1]|uniref:hypothetical protein n=1 Tax=Roseimicrobium sp. ORNL1 TaxID=2711231 RepID=UPI0013E202F6|nr:hypothetical protein [Roseimicrobium sp. ORNL1]QIF03800.1 hypothetical protein G5S37_20495 [Roseimicrobium sp. ORNL1]